jgi:hypothetical protein
MRHESYGRRMADIAVCVASQRVHNNEQIRKFLHSLLMNKIVALFVSSTPILGTYLLTYGAEFFLKSCQLCSNSGSYFFYKTQFFFIADLLRTGTLRTRYRHDKSRILNYFPNSLHVPVETACFTSFNFKQPKNSFIYVISFVFRTDINHFFLTSLRDWTL